MIRASTSSPALDRSRQWFGGEVRGPERPPEVDPDHVVPLRVGHVHEHPVAQDAGVVDEDVDPAVLLDRCGDQPLGAGLVGHVVTVEESTSSERSHLVRHLLGRPDRRAGSVGLGTEVVDDHVGAVPGELEGMCPPDAPTRTGDDHDPPLTETTHVRSPFEIPPACCVTLRRRRSSHRALHVSLRRNPTPSLATTGLPWGQTAPNRRPGREARHRYAWSASKGASR